MTELSWDGCLNVRDLGGHPTEDGGETAHAAVIRADSVRRLTARGWAAATAYGVRTVVDLRLASELELDPPHELPVDVVHVPVLDGADRAAWAEIEALAEAAPDETRATRDVYLQLLERFRPRFAEAISAVAAAPAGGVVVHCVSGKDRTGLVTALLLRLAGVSVRAVAADYALSSVRLEATFAGWIAEGEDEAERARRRRMAGTPAGAMVGVHAELDRRFGGVRHYLRSGGAAEESLGAARTRLRP